MPKTKISEFDVNPDNNTDINSINIAEGCAPSGINNAIRQLMSDLKEFQTGAGGDPFNGAINGTVGATTPSTGAFTTLSATGVATVSAGSVSAPAITTTGDTNTGIFFPAADTIAFTEGGTEAMRIDSSGNVGIGNTVASTINASSDAGNLVVGAGSGNEGITIYTGTASNGTLTFADATSGADTFRGFVQYEHTNNAMTFGTNANTRMRIDSSGNLLVGTTTLPASNRVLGFGIKNNTTGGFQCYQVSSNTDLAINANAGSIANFYSDNGSALVFAGNIQVNGNITTYLSVSDYRLKTVIGNVANSGQRIDALNPIEYDWNAGGRTRGFLAHQFAEVYPNSVSGEKDAVDKEGKPVYQGMQASTPEVMADLIAEIQSLRKRVALLESK